MFKRFEYSVILIAKNSLKRTHPTNTQCASFRRVRVGIFEQKSSKKVPKIVQNEPKKCRIPLISVTGRLFQFCDYVVSRVWRDECNFWRDKISNNANIAQFASNHP